MAYWNISADVSLGAFTGVASLSQEGTRLVDAPVSWSISTAAELVKTTKNADAAVAIGPWGASAVLTIGVPTGWRSVSAPVVVGAWTGAAGLFLFHELSDSDLYTELHDKAFLGAWKGCPGPGATVALAGEESREVVFVKYNDTNKLSVVGRRISVPGRPTAIASNALQPDLRNTPRQDPFVWVLVEEVERPTGNPKLLCYECTLAAPLVAALELDRSVAQGILWAANDTLETDFIVLCGRNGSVQIRTDDAEMRLLAKAETGVYDPAVLDVRLRPLLGPGACDERGRVWHILVFSRTGARGVLLEYREYDTAVEIAVAPQRIVAAVSMAPWTADAQLYRNGLRNISAPVLMRWESYSNITGESPTPVYTNMSAAVSLRPFTLDNTDTNIDAIEKRVDAGTAYELETAASLEIAP